MNEAKRNIRFRVRVDEIGGTKVRITLRSSQYSTDKGFHPYLRGISP